MKEIISADNLAQAEVLAFDCVKNNFKNKAGYLTISVEHNVQVLINHRGKVPVHTPNGWKFSFNREDKDDAWQLVNTEEY